MLWCVFFFQAEDGIRDLTVTGVQTCALPIFFEALCPGLWGEPGIFRLVAATLCRHITFFRGISPGQHSSVLFSINSALFAKDRKSTRLNSSHSQISYAVFCLKKKRNNVHTLVLMVDDGLNNALVSLEIR